MKRGDGSGNIMHLLVIVEQKGRADIYGAVAKIVHNLATNYEESEREGESVDDGPKEAQCHELEINVPGLLILVVAAPASYFS